MEGNIFLNKVRMCHTSTLTPGFNGPDSRDMVSDYDFNEILRGDGNLSCFLIDFLQKKKKKKRSIFILKIKFRIEMALKDRPLLVYIRNTT